MVFPVLNGRVFHSALQNLENISKFLTLFLTTFYHLCVRPRSAPTQSQQPQNLAHIVRELEDRNRRKCNVVIYGEKEGEETVVEELIKSIDSQIGMVSSPTRLGSGEKRPLLVKFKTEQEKWKVIANARAIINKNSDYKGIFVNPDFSKCEREEQYLLRQGL